MLDWPSSKPSSGTEIAPSGCGVAEDQAAPRRARARAAWASRGGCCRHHRLRAAGDGALLRRPSGGLSRDLAPQQACVGRDRRPRPSTPADASRVLAGAGARRFLRSVDVKSIAIVDALRRARARRFRRAARRPPRPSSLDSETFLAASGRAFGTLFANPGTRHSGRWTVPCPMRPAITVTLDETPLIDGDCGGFRARFSPSR